jgi:hypothetical protein
VAGFPGPIKQKMFLVALNDETKMGYSLDQLRKTRGTELANMGVDAFIFAKKICAMKSSKLSDSTILKLIFRKQRKILTISLKRKTIMIKKNKQFYLEFK